ncbi:MAG: glycosyltransferase family 2 protein [Duncaniella sp.]|nr:glycosyltransferase family 2 protein [Duncaniella sp.]
MAEVSVIIPAYNAEKFIGECIESVLAQTFHDLEIVVVDDGSADSTAEIAASYRGVKVILKQNGGQADARNYGVSHSGAPYIAFVDADDMLHPRAIEWLYRGKGEALVAAATFSHRLEGLCSAPPVFNIVTAEEAIRDTLYQRAGAVPSPCAKLVAREVMEAAPFRAGKWYEDLDWFYRAYAVAGKVAMSDSAIYFYRPNPESFIHTFSRRRLDVLEVTRRIEEWVGVNYPGLVPAARDRRLSANFDILTRILAGEGEGVLTDAEQREVISETYAIIRNYRREVMLSSSSRLKNRAGAVYSLLGLKALKLAAVLRGKVFSC